MKVLIVGSGGSNRIPVWNRDPESKASGADGKYIPGKPDGNEVL